MQMKNGERTKGQPRIGFRPLLFCALGLIFGIFFYFRVRFGGLKPSDFCFPLLFTALALVPFDWKRVLSVLLALAVFGGVGVGIAHLRTERFLDTKEENECLVSGMVCSFTVKNGRTDVILDDLSLNGAPVGGKMHGVLTGEGFRAGDIVTFSARVTQNGITMSDSYAIYLFGNDIRYNAAAADAEKVSVSGNFLLRISSALYDTLHRGMGGEEAQVAYALLTGNSHGMDAGLLDRVRTGGIAHIFAVSGLHIGILFSAVLLLFKKLGRKAYFPAIAAAFAYTAFCAFTVSSLRAFVMCAVLGAYRARGRKYDLLSALSLAALIVLFFSPGEWLTAGFRLSFGACAGLALFAGPLTRTLGRIPRLPRRLVGYVSANLSVQLATFPVLIEAFGYFSLWGFLFNLVLLPLLPVFFLTTLLFSLLALAVPPAAAFFLAAPKGTLSLFLFVLSFTDVSAVLTGFSLGMGTVFFVIGAFLLSTRVRLGHAVRTGLAIGLGVLFAAAVTLENVVFTGCRIDVFTDGDGAAALVRTPQTAVLVIDGDIGSDGIGEFLSHTRGGRLDGVIVLAEDEVEAINRAAFVSAAAVYARDEVETGLRRTTVVFGEKIEIGGAVFRFERRDKLAITAEGVVIELDFEGPAALGADFFLDSSVGGLKFLFKDGIMYTWR